MHLADVDACGCLALRMAGAQLRYYADGVEACILCQGGWNDLQGFCKCPHSIRFHPLQPQDNTSSAGCPQAHTMVKGRTLSENSFSTSQPALQQADGASRAHTASMPHTSGELSGECLSSLAQRQRWQGCRRGTHNKRLGPSRQLRGDFHLRRGSPGDHEALVHQAPDHAQRVMQRPLCLLCMQAEQSGTTYADSDGCLPTHTGYDL